MARPSIQSHKTKREATTVAGPKKSSKSHKHGIKKTIKKHREGKGVTDKSSKSKNKRVSIAGVFNKSKQESAMMPQHSPRKHARGPVFRILDDLRGT
jgi:hypothetical protein